MGYNMSVNGLKPTFTDINGYKAWRKQWKQVYADLTKRIRHQKKRVLNKQHEVARDNRFFTVQNLNSAVTLRKSMSVNAHKLMTILNEAKKRMAGITKMKKDMVAHLAQFPIRIEECNRVDFHFNKKHLEYPWIPMWVLKTKGQTFYVHHVNALCPWTTRETPSNESTKGSIRLRNCSLEIDADGVATLRAIEEVTA